jgi:hypothetical protein
MYKFFDLPSVIELKPSPNSFTELIRKHGVNYYKSPDYIQNNENINNILIRNKEEIKKLLNEKVINIEIDSELVFLWDSAKNKEELINKKIEKQKELERQKELELKKERERELEIEHLVLKQIMMENININKIILSDDENDENDYDFEDNTININNNNYTDDIVTNDDYDKWIEK